MRIRVDSSPDAHGAPTPRRIHFDDRRIDITEIRDQWDGPDYAYFKVAGADGNLYIIRHDATRDAWSLTLFQSARGKDASHPADAKRRRH